MSFDPLLQYMGAEELGLAEEGQHSPTIVGDAEEAAVVAEVSELTAVIEEQTAEIVQLVDKVEDLEETVEDLEESVEGMESMLNSGNFNSIAFSNTYNRALRLAGKLGCEYAGDRVGAESMSDAATANLMARTGIEAIGETLKNWGAKAVAFIKHIFNTIINFFVSMRSKVDALARREDQLRKRLNGGGKIKDKIKLGGWNVYVDYANDGLANASKKDKGGMTGTRNSVDGLAAEAGKVDGMTVAGLKTAYDSMTSQFKADAKDFGKYNEKKQGSKDVIVSQRAGVRMSASFSEPTITSFAEAATAIRSVSINVMKAPEAKKLSTGETKAKVDKSGLTAALDGVKAGLAVLRDDKLASKATNSTRDQIIGKLNNIKAGDSDKESDVNGKVNVVKATYALVAKVAAVLDRHATNRAGAVLDGVAAHLGFGNA
jgi:hypothetical protein